MAAPDAGNLDRSKQYLEKVIAEDIFASEEIEKMLKLVGHPTELMNKSDQNAVEGRRMLQRMMDAEGTATLEKVRQRARV
jgi:vanillate O-demethylase monooxygenase subunit